MDLMAGGDTNESIRRGVYGLEGLVDRHLREISHKSAPVDEVLELAVLYKETYGG